MNTTDLKSFHYLENGEISFSTLDTVKTTKRLDSGSYKLSYIEHPYYKVEIKKDTYSQDNEVHEFSDKQKIDDLMRCFFDKKIISTISKLGFYHKIGVLLHGKEGTGKSSIMRYYYNKAIDKENALVFHVLNTNSRIRELWDFIRKIREIQKNPIVVIFDEFDEYIKDFGSNNEGFLKTVFDGNMSIDNVIFIASTNYLDRIPDALKNRPSRFKYVIDVEGIQSKDSVCKIITPFLLDLFDENEINVFSDELKGKTLDQIKQFCLDKLMDLETYTCSRKKIGFLEK